MTNRRNKLIKKQFIQLRLKYGGKCQWQNCNQTKNLEFAHTKPTKLKGKGRGRKERYYDIKNNPTSYILLCKYHHKILDTNP